MSKNILIKPVITEKSEKLGEDRNAYTFYVNLKANKIEIKKAVEEMFEVSVTKVNTLRTPRIAKTRYTKTGFLTGKTALKKKAIVTLAEGDVIDFYADAELPTENEDEPTAAEA